MNRLTPQARVLEDALGRISALLAAAMGLFVVFLPWLPGWGVVQRVGETHFLRFLCGCLLLYAAVTIRERQRLKSRFMDLMESFDSFNSALYGREKKVTPEAVTLLVTSLASRKPELRAKAHELLKRLTGQDLGPDHEAWKRWWDRNRASFVPPGGGGEQGG